MSQNSLDTIRDIFSDGGVREVNIRISEKGKPLMWVKREMSMKDVEKEIRSLNKKGNYCDMLVKTRNGNVHYFELTEIVTF